MGRVLGCWGAGSGVDLAVRWLGLGVGCWVVSIVV